MDLRKDPLKDSLGLKESVGFHFIWNQNQTQGSKAYLGALPYSC